MRVHAPAVFLTALTLIVASGGGLYSYATSGQKWATTSVSYYVNPQSIYVSSSAAISAAQTGAAAWHDRRNLHLLGLVRQARGC